jgi:hypothetical protein
MSAENDDESKEIGAVRNLGVQPLDALMRERGVENHDLVESCRHSLTHKAVQRARQGRLLTMRTQRHVIEAFNTLVKARGEDAAFTLTQLFTYKA